MFESALCPWVPLRERAVGRRRMVMFRTLAERPVAQAPAPAPPQTGPICGQNSPSPTSLLSWWVAAGADLLEEHLGEIRNLRQRLEESICINDRLREQLEHRLSSTARGSGSGRTGPGCPVSGHN